MTAAAAITKAVQSAPVKRIGFSGLMLPVVEDTLLAQRWTEGTYDVDALLAYSAVCGTGLDTIPMAGDVTQQQIERILGDVATLAFQMEEAADCAAAADQREEGGRPHGVRRSVSCKHDDSGSAIAITQEPTVQWCSIWNL